MSTWLRLHALALGDAVRRLVANPFASLLSLAVLGLAIALPVIAAVALRSAGAAAAGLDTEPHVNVFLALDAADEDVKRVEQALRSHADAASVRFVSRDQALTELKATTHLADLLAAFDRNPLPHAFTVRMRSTEPGRIEAARVAWSRLPRVDQVVADFEWSRRLARWVEFGDRLVLVGGVLLGAAVAFIVGHLIRLQVLTRRQEIEVSQLVGATAADVRRPFLYHGALQGGLAGALAIALAAALFAWVGAELSALTPSYAAELKMVFLGPMACLLVVSGAAILGFLGAAIAVEREVRRFGASA